MVKGRKLFTLRPPSSVAHMHLQSYPVWEQALQDDFKSFSHHPKLAQHTGQCERVSWCPVDVDAICCGGSLRAEQEAQYPRYFQGAKPLEVAVEAGDLLYLPAMWYHYVRQEELEDEAVIAVNCWVDMAFDAKYAYFDFLQQVCETVGLIGVSE